MSMVDALLIFSSCCLLQIEPIMTVGATQNILPAKRIMLLGTIFALVQAGITVVGVLGAHYINVLATSKNLVPLRRSVFLLGILHRQVRNPSQMGTYRPCFPSNHSVFRLLGMVILLQPMCGSGFRTCTGCRSGWSALC